MKAKAVEPFGNILIEILFTIVHDIIIIYFKYFNKSIKIELFYTLLKCMC